jgi:hypothetical protein
MDDYAKRAAALIVAGIVIATILFASIIWFLVSFVAPDPRSPLTKAGGLKPTQDIRKVK